jgi:maltose alpha-D-glucosyltransferase/alpha-amylase
VRSLAATTLARVRQQAAVGALADALADEAFCRAVVEAIGANRELASAHGKLRFTPTRAYPELAGDKPGTLPVTQSRAQSSNTTVSLGERLFLKAYRNARPGVNPELEVGRFLTEVAGFRNCVPVAGALEYADADGTPITLALLQGYVANQGDGWTYALEHLEHFLDEHSTLAAHGLPEDVHGAFLALMATLGQRTAELHLALARPSGDPGFEPEPIAGTDITAWAAAIAEAATQTIDTVERSRDRLPQPVREGLDTLLDARPRLLARVQACALTRMTGLKTRYHGDYHLGQVLLSKNDFTIIDFEGEPARPLVERRQKHSPLRDVAGMLRSFNYARHTALLHATERQPDSYATLDPLTRSWEQQVREAFLQAYAERVKGSPLYGSFDAARPLLELFELEKAFYELRYELSHRPDWAVVPLRGILSFA